MGNLPDRLQHIISSLKLTKGSFASTGGMRAGTVTAYLKGETIPNQETLAKWVIAYGINAHWLLTGEGDMFLTDQQVPLTSPIAQRVNQVALTMTESGADELAVLNAARAMLDGEINKLTRARGGYGVAEPGPGIGRAAEEHAQYTTPDQDEGSSQG